MYKDRWDAAIGEVLACEKEPHNVEDRYAVAVRKDEAIIGHLPRNLSRVYSLFIRQGGSIECIVTGARRYSTDLPQGGLEIPCLLFKASPKEVKKLKNLWKKYLYYSYYLSMAYIEFF